MNLIKLYYMHKGNSQIGERNAPPLKPLSVCKTIASFILYCSCSFSLCFVHLICQLTIESRVPHARQRFYHRAVSPVCLETGSS